MNLKKIGQKFFQELWWHTEVLQLGLLNFHHIFYVLQKKWQPLLKRKSILILPK